MRPRNYRGRHRPEHVSPAAGIGAVSALFGAVHIAGGEELVLLLVPLTVAAGVVVFLFVTVAGWFAAPSRSAPPATTPIHPSGDFPHHRHWRPRHRAGHPRFDRQARG